MNEEDFNLQSLNKLVEALCTSGQPSLDQTKIKALKNICKQSDTYVTQLFKVLGKWLKKKHAEIRLSTFQVYNEIFLRSHCFRELVIMDFISICDLVLGVNPKSPLPKPTPKAKKLRETAIRSIKEWHNKFKDGYYKLDLCYKYLKESKSVDFENSTIWTAQDRYRYEQQQQKEAHITDRKISKVRNEMDDKLIEITNTVKQYRNCFKLLIPDLNDFFISNISDDQEVDSGVEGDISSSTIDSIQFESDCMRNHGLIKEMSIQINLFDIHKLQETSDNEVLIATLKEQIGIMKSILPKIKEWEQTVSCYSAIYPELIKHIIDIKSTIEGCIRKYNSIQFLPCQKHCINPSDSDSDSDDFIDVPLEDSITIDQATSEAFLLDIHNTIINSKGISERDISEAGPSGVQHKLVGKSSDNNERRKDQSIDSFLNEKWEPPIKCINNSAGLSQVWLANDSLHTEEVKAVSLLGIDTQIIDYKREFEPIIWECRAPLPSGRLCPRKDREVCPLHGKVVPRDEAGKPLKPKDVIQDRLRQDLFERRFPSWQDPSLLADIRSSTGIDLDIRNAKKRKRKYPNLTDLKALEKSPRKRLARKVLNKKALRRVNNRLARLEK